MEGVPAKFEPLPPEPTSLYRVALAAEEAARVHGRSYREVVDMVTRGELPNAFRDERGHWWIPVVDLVDESSLLNLPGTTNGSGSDRAKQSEPRDGALAQHDPRPGYDVSGLQQSLWGEEASRHATTPAVDPDSLWGGDGEGEDGRPAT